MLLSGLVVLSIFKNENLLWALFQLRKGDNEKALKAVQRVKAPEKLIKSQESYYYYLTGLLESQMQSLGKAEKSSHQNQIIEKSVQRSPELIFFVSAPP